MTINRYPTLYQLRQAAWIRQERRTARLLVLASIAGMVLGLILA